MDTKCHHEYYFELRKKGFRACLAYELAHLGRRTLRLKKEEAWGAVGHCV